jgi:hypothetical protein
VPQQASYDFAIVVLPKRSRTAVDFGLLGGAAALLTILTLTLLVFAVDIP